MEFELVTLRLIHIIAGAYWFGVGLFSIFFFTPAIQATGLEGQAVMRYLVGKTYFPRSMTLAGMLVILSGFYLFRRISGGFDVAWISTPSGISMTYGAVAGMAALLVSVLVQSRSAAQLSRIGRAIEAGGNPPMPEQLTAIQQLQQRLILGARATAFLMAVAMVMMAIWRYI